MMPYIYIVLPSYTVMALVGGFFALGFIFFRLGKYGIVFSDYLKLFIICLICGYLGSKILYALTQIPWLISNFSFMNLIMLIPNSGFVFYGGLFGVIFGICLFSRNDLSKRARMFRMCVPAFPLFHAFGRIGCFLTGCCYGKSLGGQISIGPIIIDRIPVQLIESLAEFILFAVLIIIDKKKENVDLLRIYLVTYAIIRFSDEFLRGDEIRGVFLGISTSQWISLAIIVFYVVRYIKQRKNTIAAAAA